MAFCVNCGTKIEEEIKFCPECGTAVGGAAEVKERRRGCEQRSNCGWLRP